MRKNKSFLFATIISIITAILLSLTISSLSNHDVKIGYANSNVVFDDFIMTRELKSNGEKEFNYRKKIVDSLYLKVQSATITEKTAIMLQFVSNKKKLEEFNQSFATIESSKIRSRIHTYTNLFAKEKGEEDLLNESFTKMSYADGIKYMSFSIEVI